ncbi:MAG: amino acid racemase [Hyphomicrobiaceae bacterium]
MMSGADDAGLRSIIGVLGGMGPLAGAWFMQRLVVLTPAVDDQDHVPAILVNDPAVPGRVAAIGQPGAESPLPAMLAGIHRLEAAGATLVAVACNTAHHWHGQLQAATTLPVLDMIARAADEVAAVAAGKPVGVLATRGTHAAGLYQRALARHGLDALLPDDVVQDRLVLPAIAAVKRGDVAAGNSLAGEADAAVRAAGAGAVLIACTELSIAWPDTAWPAATRASTVDAGDALARAALAHARGRGTPAAT